MTRYNPRINVGLTKEQLNDRLDNNLVNYDTSVPTKTIKQIIITNIFTLFNILNFVLASFIILVGSYKNLLFLGVVLCNTIISIIQEIRAKKEIDSLSLIAASKVHVVRDSKKYDINIDEIVLDDILEIKPGEQIITDVIILSGSCEVDQSFITGESDNIFYKKGDMLLSGSFIVSGNVITKVEHIGMDNYTAKISCEAKYKKATSSILMKSLNRVIKWISILIIPLGIILFLRQLNISGNNNTTAIVSTVAAIIGMIPEGLVLLTSSVLAVSVIRLSKYKVLVKDLYCIETLARIDTLCLDKTGTLTEGIMEYKKSIPLNKNSKKDVEEIMNAFCTKITDANTTIMALKEYYNKSINWVDTDIIPFSSDLKYSAITFKDKGTYYLGAPEILLKDKYQDLEKVISNDLLEYRILILTHTNELCSKKIPNNLTPISLLYIQDKIRDDAKETLAYFKNENVDIKIISGDNVKTVAGVAKRAGVDNYNKYIDMSTINTITELKEASTKYTVFGRVNPIQKKELIKALKDDGRFVAMTGDGVNDVLALKEANCSIAMPNGSDAAKNVAELVLLDSNFNSMPKVVEEGRRTVNNIEQSATLFLTKTSYATILAIIFIFLNMNYPFMPIQLTLTSVVTIGIPSFILALQPNKNIITGSFFKNVLSKSLPAAVLVVLNILAIMIFSHILQLGAAATSTLCVMMTAITGFMLLYYLCQPFNNLKKSLFISMIILFVIMISFFKQLFSLIEISLIMVIIIALLTLISITLFKIFGKFVYKHVDSVITNKNS